MAMATNPLWQALESLPSSLAPSQRYLLVNQAAWTSDRQSIRALRCFERWPLLVQDVDACEDGATPFVIHWRTDPTATAALRKLCDSGCYASGLIVLDSQLAPADLARALARRCEARISDDQDVLLRYFDTRVLAALAETLTDGQLDQFVSCTDKWWYADRSGLLVAMSRPSWPTSDCFKGPWRLSVTQENALLDASEADAMLDLLMRQRVPALLSLPFLRRHPEIQSLLTQARRWGLDSTSDQAAFCTLALEQGADVFGTPIWLQMLPTIARKELQFKDALLRYDAQP